MGPGSIAASVRSVFSSESKPRTEESVGSESAGGDSDDSSSEDEAVFAYARVSKLPPTFFRKDCVSACLVSAKLRVFATDGGVVHITNEKGDAVRTVRVHRSSVLDISVDKDSAFLATASIDGTVMVANVSDASDTVQANFRRPVNAIALNPDYAHARQYISGGTAGQVVLSERGWLKARADTVLAQTASPILALAWTPQAVVWCNNDGISVFDFDAKQVRNTVPKPANSDGFLPRMYVQDARVIIVAWARSVCTLDLATGELVKELKLAYAIAGAVPFHQSQLAVLALAPSPELKLLSETNGAEMYADELEMRQFDSPKTAQLVNQYHLLAQETASGSTNLWIVNPRDAVEARERNARDHLDWLIAHERFVEAYHANTERSEEETRSIGRRAAQQLVESGKFEQAARVLEHSLGTDATQWLLWANQFISADKALVFGDVLPPIPLSGHVHDTILERAVAARDAQRLLRFIHNWPTTVYDLKALAERLEPADMPLVFAELLLKLGEYVLAAKQLVAANSARAFGIVSHYHLWSEPEISGMLGAVLTCGDDGDYVERLRELIAFRSEISPVRVATELQRDESQDLLLFGYLSELRLVDETLLAERPLVDLTIKLYAKYDPSKLLGFLEKYDDYDIEESIAMCRARGLTNELVYLLGRLGQSREALNLIVTELKDYDRAVAFARAMDKETLDELISYASRSPKLVLTLLKCVDVSPARVLSTVPADMPIPGLKAALCAVLSEQEVSIALHEGALTIINAESRQWMETLHAKRLAGTECSENIEAPVLVTEEGAVKVDEYKGAYTGLGGKVRHWKELYARLFRRHN